MTDPVTESGTTYPSKTSILPTAGWGRRLGALLIDWWICIGISRLLLPHNTWGPSWVFLAEQALLTGTVGFSIGQFLFGLRVGRCLGGWANPGRVLLRTLLLELIIPAVIVLKDGRGLHDGLAGTVITRR